MKRLTILIIMLFSIPLIIAQSFVVFKTIHLHIRKIIKNMRVRLRNVLIIYINFQ